MPQIKLMSCTLFRSFVGGRLAKSVKNLSFFQTLSNHIQSKYLCKLAFRSVLGYVRTKKIMSTCFPLFDYWLTLKSIHTYWSSITNTTRDDKYQKTTHDGRLFFISFVVIVNSIDIFHLIINIWKSDMIWNQYFISIKVRKRIINLYLDIRL